jgi:hypothetical protein
MLKPHTRTYKYNISSIYQLKYLYCAQKYIRQARYKEHIDAIRNNNSNSRYSNHILKHRAYIWGHTGYYGYCKDRKEGQIFKHLRKISYL